MREWRAPQDETLRVGGERHLGGGFVDITLAFTLSIAEGGYQTLDTFDACLNRCFGQRGREIPLGPLQEVAL